MHAWNVFLITNRLEGRERKIRWSSSKGGQTMCACAHLILPSASGFQGASRQAGRQNPRFSQSCAPPISYYLYRGPAVLQ